MRFQVKPCKGGWQWRIIAKNHKILASSEVYKTRLAAERTAVKVKMRSMYSAVEVL